MSLIELISNLGRGPVYQWSLFQLILAGPSGLADCAGAKLVQVEVISASLPIKTISPRADK